MFLSVFVCLLIGCLSSGSLRTLQCWILIKFFLFIYGTWNSWSDPEDDLVDPHISLNFSLWHSKIDFSSQVDANSCVFKRWRHSPILSSALWLTWCRLLTSSILWSVMVDVCSLLSALWFYLFLFCNICFNCLRY